ncbi:MAG: hypothetical protein JW951_09840 [Lentisphaerae bacterium]|nr:hypothetical protein [Lentisphaerota bacterium]
MRKLVILLTILIASGLTVNATPLVQDDFNGDDGGWTTGSGDTGTDVGPQYNANLGGQQALEFELTTYGGGAPEQGYITDGGGATDLVGQFNSGDYWTIEFGFYANADDGSSGGTSESPAGLYVYFEDTDTGNIWYYDVLAANGYTGGLPAQDWYYFEVPVGGSDWDTSGGTHMLTDILNADELGVWVVYQPWDNQEYGLDYYGLSPEPQTYATLAFALVGLGATFRRRLNGMLAGVFKK